ncbi:uncharacterized protein LOC118406095 [Branchiostoma floridae]|uniref:Uncharacterized protein LOC118406095 n=1 Tax=Branchiostoma floridae TaxID=7739 RepID=A0A9J7KGG7_BRAFL|nr:uncharacterized protein LOC118406095 [Branchiostoma floridae]
MGVIIFLVLKLRRMSRKEINTEDPTGAEYDTIGRGSSPADPRGDAIITPATSVGTAGQRARSATGITNSGAMATTDNAPTLYLQNTQEESPYQALNPNTMESNTYTSLDIRNKKPKNDSTYTSLCPKGTAFYQNMAFVGDQGAIWAEASRRTTAGRGAARSGGRTRRVEEAIEMDHVYLDLNA